MYEQLTLFDRMIFDDVPAGWRVLEGAINHPRGYRWVCNNKSLFGGEYQHALVPEEKAIEWRNNHSRQGNGEESAGTRTA